MKFPWGSFVVLVAGGVVALWFVALFVEMLATDRDCVHWGWREPNVTWDGSRYCTARVGQTDVVAPYGQASQGPLSYARTLGITR